MDSGRARALWRSAGPRQGRDWGRALARLLCAIFALIGAVPLSGGLVLRSEPMQRWAASETSRVLREQLGVVASFTVEVQLIPLRVAVSDLSVPGSDGQGPALTTSLAAVSPRFFSLLAGRLDVGDVELEDGKVRLVVRDGEVKNVDFKFPKTQGKKPELTRSPFRSLSLSGASLDLQIDDMHVRTGLIDADVLAEDGLTFDAALRIGGATFDQLRDLETGPISDEDQLCAFDVRATVSPDRLMVRRLSLLGGIDLDPRPGTRASCAQSSPGRVAVRLSQTKVTRSDSGAPIVRGHVMFRAPAALANRLAKLQPFTGWAGFSGEMAYSPDSRLPELEGVLTGEALSMGRYVFAKRVKADVQISGDVIQIPKLEAEYGNGTVWLTGATVKPFAPGMPLQLRSLRSKGVDFPGMMRDTGAAPNTIVDWNFGDMEVTGLSGTIQPFSLDARLSAKTHDFAVYNRPYHDPSKKRMIGVRRGDIDGRFRAHAKALEFYDTVTRFGHSTLPIELISIGWHNDLLVRLGAGGTLDLADVSPIADIDVSGLARLEVEMAGPAKHPILEGSLSVSDLMVGGFFAGDLKRSGVHFEPLYVDFIDAEGQKGDMIYNLPTARLRFDGPAGVEFTGVVDSPQFVIRQFFDIFNFDDDPRFDDISGRGSTTARVRYLLGGPEDTCESGRLLVEGTSTFSELSAFGESFDGGESDFSFEWFDIRAGSRGMRVDVPAAALRKGSGTIFGSARMTAGGHLTGDFVGTKIPVTQLNLLGAALGQVDGSVTGTGRLDGNAEALAFTANLAVSELRSGDERLPPSELHVRLEPASWDFPTSGEVTACGRPMPPAFSLADYESDELEGTFHLTGKLFGGQLAFDDLALTSQRRRKARGRVVAEELDLGALSAALNLQSTPLRGHLSGDIDLEQIDLTDPFASRAEMTLRRAHLEQTGLSLSLNDAPARFSLQDGALQSHNLSFGIKTPAGQAAILDARFSLDRSRQIDGRLQLRETSLGMLGEAIPGVQRAEGRLSASFEATGNLTAPQLRGQIEVKQGLLNLTDLPTPVTDFELRVDVDQNQLSITQGSALWGGGIVELRGRAPLARGELGDIVLSMSGRTISLPLGQDTRVSFDTDLELLVPATEGQLPRLSGTMNLLSAAYRRSVNVTADIGALTARGKKTEVTAYDPAKDFLGLDVALTAQKPVVIQNDLVDATLQLDPEGLRITGTNQRFGVVGNVELPRGGRIFLRDHEFKIQNGTVQFNDPTRARPEVDVSAITEYRRMQDRTGNSTATSSTISSTGAPIAGNWRILLHAYGEPDNLKVDLSSDPPLAQDDIFLLLAVGLTRTELNQAQTGGVGSSVALEALGSLSGAESAVTKTVPIDEFHFGSTYSSRSGRTEPTVTIGKRLSDRIRASVTTSLSDTSEVRSNVEYQASGNLSVEGSYDNAQSSGSSSVGNVGGDVRWRLEFE